MHPAQLRVAAAELTENLAFWYRNHEFASEAEFESRGSETFSVRFFRPQASEFLFNHDQLPEVVVVEPDVPRQHGIFLATKLAASNIPLILYTPLYSEEARTKAIAWGVDEYLFGAIGIDFWNQIRVIRALKQHAWEEMSQKHLGQSVTTAADSPLPAFKHHHVKRTFDIIGASLFIILLSPILLVIALIIKLESRGPIIYKSKRAGTGYRVFDFYKFRSMKVGADQQLALLKSSNQYSGDAKDQIFHKIKNDPRVTRFGRILRKTSLDELPQLFNVLKGDMSLVGNRPLPLYEAEMLTKDGAAWRFLAPAGITGLWQVTKRGKNNMSNEERIELDATYARNYSVWVDMKILAGTFTAMIQQEKV